MSPNPLKTSAQSDVQVPGAFVDPNWREPRLLRAWASKWPATRKWSPGFVGEMAPDYVAKVYDFTLRDAIPCSMMEFVSSLETSRDAGERYLAWDSGLLRLNPHLADDLRFSRVFPRHWLTRLGFWMGGPGAHTPLHTDIDAPNLHVVFSGRKRFQLFSPRDTANLYPSDVYEWSTVFSQVDVRNPDCARFPRFRDATCIDLVLEAGDAVFIPCDWWHGVTCLETTVSVNAWAMGPRVFGSPKLYRDLGKAALHRLGLWRRNRCTCHSHGDLRRYHGWKL